MFDAWLATPESIAAFSDKSLVGAMLRFERALAQAQAAAGLIPESAAAAIESACRADLYDASDIVAHARRAGSLAIPLVNALRKEVARRDDLAARQVHLGSTSQDVLDSALVQSIGNVLALIDADLTILVRSLLSLAQAHAATPLLGRTLMQSAQVITFGLKAANWAAPLVRSQAALRDNARRALTLQLGGAVGTLSEMGPGSAAIAARMAVALGLGIAPSSWHTQRDELARLGAELGILTGSLGKIAADLALLGQPEVGEVAEPAAPGRGASSAMPHKRNPVSSMIALAAAQRAPQRVATLIAAMVQEHERGLGNWQAELAEWPGLLTGAHAAVRALAEAIPGLAVDARRMLSNIDAARAAASSASPAEADQIRRQFDPAGATAVAAETALRRVNELRAQCESFPIAPWPPEIGQKTT